MVWPRGTAAALKCWSSGPIPTLQADPMIIDIREEVPAFLDYLRQRVEQQVAHTKTLKRPRLIRRIDFGFEFGQGNELWLVFDTRPDAGPDGEWTVQVQKVPALKRPNWPIWADLPKGEVVNFINLQGETVNVMRSPDKKICKIVGEAMKHAMLTARDQGIFEPLSRAERCELGVENMEGFYGWPHFEDRGKENLLSSS